MGKFYIPRLIRAKGTPVIVYPCEGVENMLGRESLVEAREHLETLYSMNKFPRGKFNIAIFWEYNRQFMTDLWTFTNLESWNSGALSTARTFMGCSPHTSLGTSAEFGHIMLGREAEHRLFGGARGEEMSLQEYLKSRPALPSRITNRQRYFLV